MRWLKDIFGYEGKVCVVTGAANGIGKHTVNRLVDLGAIVYGLDYDKVDSENVTYVPTNLGSKASIDKAFMEIPKRIDCFFGVAGVSGLKHSFVETVEINYLANRYIIENYLMDRMIPGSAIGIVTSLTAYRWNKLVEDYRELVETKTWDDTVETIKDWSIQFPTTKYGLSKLAMNFYNIHMVKPLGEKGIRINTLMPGSTATQLRSEFDAGMKQLTGDLSRQQKGIGDRLAEPREVAEPLIFLNSNMASFISGQQICVDNGSVGMIEAGVKVDNFIKSKLVDEIKYLNSESLMN